VAVACLAPGCLEAPPGADVAGTPSAAFATQSTFLQVFFDASLSRDPDGELDSYAWTFGDGATGTGVEQAHAYEAPGTYTVELTVTDDEGNSDSIENDVTVEQPPIPLAVDGFARTVELGWGFADVGGMWAVDVDAAFAVDGAAGTISLGAGEVRNARLAPVDSLAYELTFVFTSEDAPTGAGLHVRAVGREVADTAYLLSTVLHPDGVVDARLEASTAGENGVSLAGPLDLPGITYAPGDVLAMRLQVEGTSPTQLRAKVWPMDAAEPSDWLFEETDDTAGLQEPGDVGIASYLSGSATATPVTVTIDDFVVRPLQ
jgi:PKD repeat protein